MFFDGGPLRSVPAPVTKARTLMRPVGGLAVLAFLLWRLGSGPFLDGLRLIDSRALAAALGIGVLTTVCCAWRWRLVAGGRGVRHGRDVGDVGRGIRAVVWERSAGQVVQVAVALVVLCAFPSPVRSYLPAATALLVAGALGTVLLARALPRRGPSRWARALRTAEADVRGGLLARGTWLGVVLASAVVAGGYLATFLVAARTAGATAPLSRLVPLTVLALMAMLVPANIGGFGPREGVAAWAFGAAGLTAAQGVATAMVYGVLVLVASLPGAAVLMVRWVRAPAADPQADPHPIPPAVPHAVS